MDKQAIESEVVEGKIGEEGKEVDRVERLPATGLGAIGGEMMLSNDYVEATGKQIELRSKLLMTALKALKPHDFQDFDGKPYLEGEGAARIMAVVRGFRVGEAIFKVEHIAPHYFIESSIQMEFMGATTVAIGDCSTADSFFTGRDGNAGRYKKYLDQTGSETIAARLLLGDAKKKARENAISRGVSELLGIKGLTWDDLAQLGFSRTQAGSTVKFKTGSQGGEIKTLSVSELLKVAKGSVVNVKGKVVDAKARTVKRGDGQSEITDYVFTDDKAKAKIMKWGGCIDELKSGDIVFASNVQVSEYQGTLQYLAKELSIVKEEVVSNGSNGNTN